MSTTTKKDRAQEIADGILTAFEEGRIPKALAHVFLAVDESPSTSWSWLNRLTIALNGHTYARGFRQWQKVGRSVKKGERACSILIPIKKWVSTTETDAETGEEKKVRFQITVGFKGIPVFGFSQTEGDDLPGHREARAHIDHLPLVDVARSWGIKIDPFNAATRPHLGLYNPGSRKIGLGVKNLSTWAHELMHAADHRVQGDIQPGQRADQEIVAELGGAVLLECLGYEDESDRGGCWEYIQSYAENSKKAIKLATELVDRTCEAVALILRTAEELEANADDTVDDEDELLLAA